MDKEKVKGRVDVNGRVEEVIDGILDSEAQKPKSSCLLVILQKSRQRKRDPRETIDRGD